MINPSTVSIAKTKVTMDLIPSKAQPSSLELVATVLPNDLMRIHIAEKTPFENRIRYEATDVLMPGTMYCVFVIGRVFCRTRIVNY